MLYIYERLAIRHDSAFWAPRDSGASTTRPILVERGGVAWDQPLEIGIVEVSNGAHEVSLRCVRGCVGVVVGDSLHLRVEKSLRLRLATGAKADILVHAAYIPNNAIQYDMAYEFACQREPVRFRNEEVSNLWWLHSPCHNHRHVR